MPEATAQLTKPVNEQPIRIDDSLNQIRQSIGANADQAIGNKGKIHNPIPVPEREIPIHVPTGTGKTTPVSEKEGYVAPPDTFQKPESNLFNHMIHGVDRTGTASEIVAHKQKKNDKLMQARNNSNSKGIISNIKDWFYDEDKKAA